MSLTNIWAAGRTVVLKKKKRKKKREKREKITAEKIEKEWKKQNVQ